MTRLEEWKNDFKGFINELSMPKDDYNGIMEYIDEVPNEERWISVSERLPDDNATNGEVFGKIMDFMFMDNAYITTDKHGYLHLRGVKDDWWNAPYQKGGKE